ncbi:MAG: hypothetical protein ACFFEE_12390 [Candidatus Thorarchaeota archaeon]
MKRRTRALIPLSLLLTVSLAAPVSAFYFDFQYFETDKLVYEVGETIDMVSKLIADFSNQGWCYVSFAVVTDLGPSFADEYFIPPSSDVRFLNSSYTILPDHTSPNITGAQGFVIFNVEIFDTVSQGAGDNIEITIIRGHLDVNPESSLTVQSGIDKTLTFRVKSIYNESIAYADEQVSILVADQSSQTVLDTTLLTTTEGLVSINWNDSLGPPGSYILTLSGSGNEDFLPFSDSFQVAVLPAFSNLSIISAPISVHSQSPDGSHFEQAAIIVEHEDLNLNPLNDSAISWETSFGSGFMTNQGNGLYSVSIPFQTGPGNQFVNITATNPQFQSVQEVIPIDVLPNSLQFSPVQPSWNVTRGQNITIEFIIESEIDWNQSIQIQFVEEDDEFIFESDIYPGITNYIEIPAASNHSIGMHIVDVLSISSYYEFQNSSAFILNVIGILNPNISINSAFYGESLNFSVSILDDSYNAVNFVDISLYWDYSPLPFSIINNINSSTILSISLPLWIPPGHHNISFRLESDYFHNFNRTIAIQIWMRTNLSIIISASNVQFMILS